MPPATILIAEDDGAIRGLIEILLTEAGFKTTSVINGREAIEQLQQRRYDGIVLDLMMAPVGGDEVLEWLEEHTPELLPRTLIFSASTEAFIDRLCRDRSCKRLMKPFDVEVFGRTVQECFGRNARAH